MRPDTDSLREAQDLPPPEPGSPGKRCRVLLADDNADMRDYLHRLLQQDYDVRTAVDGVSALDQIRAEPPDLVLTDVMMPRLDGFGLVAAIRADAGLRSLPVILLSAGAGEEARIEGLQAGADEYLIKPFRARELMARVALQIELARQRRAANSPRADAPEQTSRFGAKIDSPT